MTTAITEFFIMLAQEITAAPIMTAKELKYISPSPVISPLNIALYLVLFATTFFLTYVAVSFSGLSLFS